MSRKFKFILTALALITLSLFIWDSGTLWASKAAPYFLIDGDVIYLITGFQYLNRFPPPLLWSPAIPQMVLVALLNVLPNLAFKIAGGQPYSRFVFDHLGVYLFYSRFISMLISFGVVLFGTYQVMAKLRSATAGIFFFAGLLSIRFFPDAWSGFQFDAETFSLAIFVFWMVIALNHFNHPSRKTHYLLFVLAGFICTQKFCNLPLIIITFFFTQNYVARDLAKKSMLLSAVRDFAISIGALAIGALPVYREFLKSLVVWSTIPFHSEPYNTGRTSFFDFQRTWDALIKFASMDATIFSFVPGLIIYFIAVRTQSRWMKWAGIFIGFTCLLYLKLGIWRYLVIPLAAFWFLGALVLSLASSRIQKTASIFAIVLLILMPFKELRMQARVAEAIESSVNLESYLQGHPAHGRRIITYIFAEEFARWFGNLHAQGYFPNQYYLRDYPVGHLYDIDNGYFEPLPDIGGERQHRLMDSCWTQLIVRDIYFEKVKVLVDKKVSVEQIPHSKNFVFSRHDKCDELSSSDHK